MYLQHSVAEINQVPPVLGNLSHRGGVTASQLPYLITHNLHNMNQNDITHKQTTASCQTI